KRAGLLYGRTPLVALFGSHSALLRPLPIQESLRLHRGPLNDPQDDLGRDGGPFFVLVPGAQTHAQPPRHIHSTSLPEQRHAQIHDAPGEVESGTDRLAGVFARAMKDSSLENEQSCISRPDSGSTLVPQAMVPPSNPCRTAWWTAIWRSSTLSL